MGGLTKFIRDNGLSIAFIVLFILCLAGQIACGYASSPDRHGVVEFLHSSVLLQGIFGNWQAALLQLFVLVVLAGFLLQRGASHSRKTENNKHADTRLSWFGQRRSWVYSHSLAIALLVLCAASFWGFLYADAKSSGAQRGMFLFLFSAKFWFHVFATWQAEFFAMAVFLIMTIFLRQEGSAESKPVNASNGQTGETNK